jgi:hypothetical protein
LPLPSLWADWCVVFFAVFAGTGLHSCSCLAILFESVVLTSSVTVHMALNWLWQLSPRIPPVR